MAGSVLIVLMGAALTGAGSARALPALPPLFAAGAAQSLPAAPSSRTAEPAGDSEPKSEVYRRINGLDLKLHIFSPPGHQPTDRRAAVVFFFGGGWRSGSVRQFEPQSRYLAERGMVAITADYRVYDRHQAKVADCVSDAQAAVRWVRAHARRLGIDPDRIAAGGGSAGGHLAAAAAMLDDFTGEQEPRAVSFRPNALVLFNPALDLTLDRPAARNRRGGIEGVSSRLGAEPKTLSPADHVRPGLPPVIIFHGRNDRLIPYAQMEAFAEAMRKAGNRCELVGFEGQGHGFFNRGESFKATLQQTERFLRDLGYLEAGPRTRPARRP
ncbi:MAG: alpha/beta hydrolase [Phycisphaerae bacterium]